MELDELEPRIRAIARRYGGDADSIADLTQEGLVAAWLAYEGAPDREMPYYLQAAKWAISGVRSKERAKKRSPQGGFVSIHDPLFEDGVPLEEVIGGDADDRVRQEKLDELLGGLRQEYTKWFVHRINVRRDGFRIRRAITRFVVEEVEGIPIEDIPSRVTQEFFAERGLERFLHVLYADSPVSAIEDAYPGRFVPWNFNKVPRNYWVGPRGYTNARNAMRWLLQKHGVTKPSEVKRVKQQDMIDAGLSGALKSVFGGSFSTAVSSVMPEVKPWNFLATPPNYFDDRSNQHLALTSFLIAHGAQPLDSLTPEETYDQGLRRFVKRSNLCDFGLNTLLHRYSTSTWRLFNEFYAPQMLPWTLKGVSEPWRDDPVTTGTDAMRWLIEDYLELPVDELPMHLSQQLLNRVGFSGIMTNKRIGFSGRTYLIADRLYPGRFEEWDFRRARRGIIVPDIPDFQVHRG